MLHWNWRSQLSLIRPYFGQKHHFWFSVRCLAVTCCCFAITCRVWVLTPAEGRAGRRTAPTCLPVCLFIFWAMLLEAIRRFQVQVLEILQHLVSPATHLAGFLEAAWGGEDKSLTYHFNYIAWRLHRCKAIVKEGRRWRPLSVCEEQTSRWPSPCRADHFQRFSLSLLLSSTACMRNSAHGREHPVLCKRVFLFLVHQLTGRCQRPRLLNCVQKDKFM